jgi:hypothetical protein
MANPAASSAALFILKPEDNLSEILAAAALPRLTLRQALSAGILC